jgi:hypothetical protein
LKGFWHGRHLLVEIVEDATLPLELPLDRLFAGLGLLERIVEIFVGLFEAFPVTGAVTEGVSDDEAEGSGQQHPYR